MKSSWITSVSPPVFWYERDCDMFSNVMCNFWFRYYYFDIRLFWKCDTFCKCFVAFDETVEMWFIVKVQTEIFLYFIFRFLKLRIICISWNVYNMNLLFLGTIFLNIWFSGMIFLLMMFVLYILNICILYILPKLYCEISQCLWILIYVEKKHFIVSSSCFSS